MAEDKEYSIVGICAVFILIGMIFIGVGTMLDVTSNILPVWCNASIIYIIGLAIAFVPTGILWMLAEYDDSGNLG